MDVFIMGVKCYSSHDYNTVLNMSFGCLRAKINSVTHYLTQHGLEVVEMWECDYKRKNNINKSMISSALLKFDKYLPLHPGQALYSGRMSPVWLKKHVSIMQRFIMLILFHFILVFRDFSFPIGHPSILVGNECDEVNFDQFCGLVKCNILPPKNLYFPVLPCKFNGKLIFTLCRSCVFNTEERHKVNINCQHLDEEWTLTGVWCSPEIKKAS